MNLFLLIRLFVCVFVFAVCLAIYMARENQLTELKMKIPQMARVVKGIEEDNLKLEFEIASFCSPEKLLELKKRPEFGHLRFPKPEEVIEAEVDKGAKL